MKRHVRKRGPIPNPYFDDFMEMGGQPAGVSNYERLCAFIEAGTFSRRFAMRDRLINKYAWAVPNDAAIRAIARYSPIVEMGGGSGYWARCLSDAGAEVTCFDRTPPRPHRAWYPVRKGTPQDLTAYPECALLLCWPPYNTFMGYDALKYFPGQIVCYVGEGSGGCTGNDAFHTYLEEHFDELECVALPQHVGIHDHLMIYKRREQ